MTKDEAKALVKGPFGSELLKTITKYVAPLFWIQPQKEGFKVINNGTTFFIYTPIKTFGVTADHVFQGFIKAKVKNQSLICRIHNLIIDLEDRLIDRNKELDIATFHISPQEVEQVDKWFLTNWPPVIPEIDKGIMFAGFPGEARKQYSSGKVEWGAYPATGIATSVSDRIISCQFERKYWIETPPFKIPPENFDISGLSGAPMLTLIENDMMSWSIGGVMTDFHPDFKIAMASRADVILPDGMLKKN